MSNEEIIRELLSRCFTEVNSEGMSPEEAIWTAQVNMIMDVVAVLLGYSTKEMCETGETMNGLCTKFIEDVKHWKEL